MKNETPSASESRVRIEVANCDGRHAQLARADRCAGLGQDHVQADRAQQRAFARHVRAGDQDERAGRTDFDVVARTRIVGDERMAELAGNDRRSRAVRRRPACSSADCRGRVSPATKWPRSDRPLPATAARPSHAAAANAPSAPGRENRSARTTAKGSRERRTVRRAASWRSERVASSRPATSSGSRGVVPMWACSLANSGTSGGNAAIVSNNGRYCRISWLRDADAIEHVVDPAAVEGN